MPALMGCFRYHSPLRGLLKKSAPLRIDHCRHSGESRNPVPSGMAILRVFISSSLAGINQKIKKKAKHMDSGMRRNDEQSRTAS